MALRGDGGMEILGKTFLIVFQEYQGWISDMH